MPLRIKSAKQLTPDLVRTHIARQQLARCVSDIGALTTLVYEWRERVRNATCMLAKCEKQLAESHEAEPFLRSALEHARVKDTSDITSKRDVILNEMARLEAELASEL